MRRSAEGLASAAPRRGIGHAPTCISPNEWRALREMIYRHAGVALSPSKETLLMARLGKRVAALRLDSYGAYVTHLLEHDPSGEERQRMINAITTHQTEFFRGPAHFDFLLPWSARFGPETLKRGGMRVWCAACSTGQEAYTLAAVLSRALSPSAWRALRILATDIDTDVLRRARVGEYPDSVLAEVPPEFQGLLFEPAQQGIVRVREELRRRIDFEQHNLVRDTFVGEFELIFCRNVLIYFDADTRRAVIDRLAAVLRPHGLLFLAHAEALPSVPPWLKQTSTSVYERIAVGEQPATPKSRLQVGNTGWTHFFVSEGFLLSVRGERSGRCGVTHVRSEEGFDLPKIMRTLTSAVRVDDEVLRGKIVRAPSRQCTAPIGGEYLEEAMKLAQIEIAVCATHQNAFRAWVDMSSGRVFVQDLSGPLSSAAKRSAAAVAQ